MSLEVKGQNTVRNLAEGTGAIIRQLRGGEMGVGHVHPRYSEATRRLGRFYAANQAAVTTTAALATTYTGLVVYNPVSSPVDLHIDKVGCIFAAAPAAIAGVGMFSGFSAAGIVTHTTPLATTANCYVGGSAGYAKADAAATLVGSPQWMGFLIGAFTAAALGSQAQAFGDMEGSAIIPPGGYFGLATISVSSVLYSIAWEEVLRQPA